MAIPYPVPLDKLVTLGDPREWREWPDYLALGFTQDDIPELIRMATDHELLWPDSDSLQMWAPIHAWRTLGQFRAESAVEPLIALWKHTGEDDGYDDWLLDDMPDALAMIGEAAIASLEKYLLNLENGDEARAAAADALQQMGEDEPDLRDRVVSILSAALEHYRDNSEFLNGALAADLVDLKAVESAAVIKAAYHAHKVDLLVQGEWKDVASELGLEPTSVPGPDPLPEDMDTAWEKVLGMPRSQMVETFNRAVGDNTLADLLGPEFPIPVPGSSRNRTASMSSSLKRAESPTEQGSIKSRRQSEKKAKSKRKQEKKSRKQNRQRR